MVRQQEGQTARYMRPNICRAWVRFPQNDLFITTDKIHLNIKFHSQSVVWLFFTGPTLSSNKTICMRFINIKISV